MGMEQGGLYLGGLVDPETGERTGEPLVLESHHLTTHGVIVGMTGSGKTGLGVDLIEEALLQGIPCLVIDPKGDMGNLALTFPELRPEDFQPWMDPQEARRQGTSVADLAFETAARWRDGLASWGIGPDRLRRLRTDAEVLLYTPGSQAGIPLNVVGSLAAPRGGFDEDPETYRDEIESLVSSLLTLADLPADPVADPGHILISSVIEEAWRRGEDLDLAGLLGRIVDPPFRQLGVFEVDQFVPRERRTKLAMRLNGLIASPSFAAWLEGDPLDVPVVLGWGGRPRAAVIYLAHLSEAERQFVVTLLLSKVVSWMRRLPGSSDLKALIYMDEVFGFCPPTAEPPSKKPILTILKQARAYGVGMVAATQNPVDLDYKAMSNAGMWMVGRLQTERDKARILEALSSASGDVDVASLDRRISGLGKRRFLLYSTRSDPRLFETRWAMSYLAGPLTRDQIGRLVGERPTTPRAPQPAEETAWNESTAPDLTPVAPRSAVATHWLDPAAPWASTVGADPTGTVWEAAAVARVRVRYDDRVAGVDHAEEYEAVIYPLGDDLGDNLISVDHDPRDLRDTPPANAVYRIPEVDVSSSAFWKSLGAALKRHLDDSATLTVFKNPALGLYSRVGETEEEFKARCRQEAERRADAEVAKLRDRYAVRIERLRDRLVAAERRVAELEVDVKTRRQQEVVAGAGSLLRLFLGGKLRSTGLSGAASRRAQTRRTEERLESARMKVDDAEADIADLEDELADQITSTVERWAEAAEEVEPVEIGLESDDIEIESLDLLWIPRAAENSV